MTESSDPQLHLKKKARRRLVGAVAIAGLAAVILPMVMDDEPKQPVQEVQIRIPGQDQLPFDPKELAARSSSALAGDGQERAVMVPADVAPPAEEPSGGEPDKAQQKAAAKPVEKPVDKPAVKKTEKPAATRAPEIDKKPEAPPAAANGQYVILVGAFANPDNVKKLLIRIKGVGVPTYTEILNSPAGKRTRVRAGPFPNREAAEKALDKLKRIGVGGVVAGRS